MRTRKPLNSTFSMAKVLLVSILLQLLTGRTNSFQISLQTEKHGAERHLLQNLPPANSTGLNTTEGISSTTTLNATSSVNGSGTNATSGVNTTSPEAAPLTAPSPEMQMVPEPQSPCGGTSPCLNGGQPMLIERNNNVSCVCNCTLAVGFDGDHCEAPRQICSPDGFFCSNGGICAVPSTPGGAFSCHCPFGFYGLHCLDKGVVCTQTLICKNGGTCNETTTGSPQCKCAPGYGGPDCGSDVKTPSAGGPASFFQNGKDKANPVGVVFGIIGGLLVLGLVAAGGVFCWRRYRKRQSPYSFDYLYNQQSAPMTGGAFSEVQMEDLSTEREYRNGTNIQSTSLNL